MKVLWIWRKFSFKKLREIFTIIFFPGLFIEIVSVFFFIKTHFCDNELEKSYHESFPRGLFDISDYDFQSLKNLLALDYISVHVHSIKPAC